MLRAAVLAPWSIRTILPVVSAGKSAAVAPVPAYTTDASTGALSPVILPLSDELICQLGPFGSVAFGDVTLAVLRVPVNGTD